METKLQQLERVDKPKKGRHYQLPSGRLAPSVTNVLGIKDKPALMHWAANREREHCVDVASRLKTDYEGDWLSPGEQNLDFETNLRARLGQKKAHAKESKRAANIGTEIHDLIQWHLKNRLGEREPRPKVTEGAELGFMAWVDWAHKVNLEPIMVEQTVWSDRLFSAGTMDLYGIFDYPEPGARRHCVFDWKGNKTSKMQPNGIYPEALVQVSTYAQMLVELDAAPDNTMGCIVRLPKTLDDPIFEEDGEVDHVEIMPSTRKSYAEGFRITRQMWSFWREEMGS